MIARATLRANSARPQVISRKFFLARATTLLPARTFSSSSGDKPATEWRKQQLDKLEKKFSNPQGMYAEPEAIEKEEELQPMWKNMESRVRNRRPQTLADTKGKTGRQNIKKTDEEMWLQEGLYNDDEKK